MMRPTTRHTAVMIASLWLWVAAIAAVPARTAHQAARSVNAGVYTEQQAKRGAEVFDKNCSMCHDTPRFTGDAFLSAWVGKPLHGLFEVIRTTMPEDNPGSLKPQQYGDVVAYFLQLNKYPAGGEELQATP